MIWLAIIGFWRARRPITRWASRSPRRSRSSAVRSSDSTTTIRLNEVIIARIDGAIDSTVRRNQLDYAISEAGALAEVDADVLSVRGCEQ